MFVRHVLKITGFARPHFVNDQNFLFQMIGTGESQPIYIAAENASRRGPEIFPHRQSHDFIHIHQIFSRFPRVSCPDRAGEKIFSRPPGHSGWRAGSNFEGAGDAASVHAPLLGEVMRSHFCASGFTASPWRPRYRRLRLFDSNETSLKRPEFCRARPGCEFPLLRNSAVNFLRNTSRNANSVSVPAPDAAVFF